MFHNSSVRVPLLITDPAPAADVTRAMVSEALVEVIGLAPSFVQTFGGPALPHILEGRFLMPLLHGLSSEWRKVAIREYDYAFDLARVNLAVPIAAARLYMVYDGRSKIHPC